MPRQALIDVFTRLRPRLELMLAGRATCRATIDDVLQDTWLKLAARTDADAVGNANGFVVTTARNTLIDHLRRQNRRRMLEAALQAPGAAADGPDPERILAARELLAAVRAALDDMPPRSREIFLMNRIDGVSHREIARRLDISETAVYYHIRRVVERLAAVRDGLAR